MSRVLVLGYRKGLADALKARGVPWSLWVQTPPLRPPKGVPMEVAPFPVSGPAATKIAARFAAYGEHTHVIAAGEDGVVSASHARRALNARRSRHTVANRCHDKLFMKETMSAAGVAVADFLDLNRPDARERARELGAPLIVKDRRSSGSRGLDILDTPESIAQLPTRNRLAEAFVRGVEMSVEAFVHDGQILWTNTTEYFRPREVNIVPAKLSDDNARAAREVNRATIDALGISWGMTHLELFLTAAGPVVSEIALRPPGGYIMDLIELSAGFDPWAAFVAIELGETFAFGDGAKRRSAGAIILHPGEGLVDGIRGLDDVRAHPDVRSVKLKVRAGSKVAERIGVGMDVGRVIIAADDHAAVVDAVRFVDATLRIDLVD